MHIRHVAGAAAVTLLAFAAPGVTAQAQTTGVFQYSLPGGNEGKVDAPVPHRCYEIGASDKRVTTGFNDTVFTATLYAGANCEPPAGQEVPSHSGFSSDPMRSVAFRPAKPTSHSPSFPH